MSPINWATVSSLSEGVTTIVAVGGTAPVGPVIVKLVLARLTVPVVAKVYVSVVVPGTVVVSETSVTAGLLTEAGVTDEGGSAALGVIATGTGADAVTGLGTVVAGSVTIVAAITEVGVGVAAVKAMVDAAAAVVAAAFRVSGKVIA